MGKPGWAAAVPRVARRCRLRGAQAARRRFGIMESPTADSRIAKDDPGIPAAILRVSAMRSPCEMFPFQTRLMAISDYE
jgi:hypothetical protein